MENEINIAEILKSIIDAENSTICKNLYQFWGEKSLTIVLPSLRIHVYGKKLEQFPRVEIL
jgi:hypothetical protein